MSRYLIRPNKVEIEGIRNALITTDLPPQGRKKLRLILSWATGSKYRELAREFRVGTHTIQQNLAHYRLHGIDGFTGLEHKRKGRAPISGPIATAIEEAIRMGVNGGSPLPYRQIAKDLSISIGTVCAYSKKLGLSGDTRCGKVGGALRHKPVNT